MPSSHEHAVVDAAKALKQKAANLAPGPEADDIRAAIEALIKALSVSGYTF